MQKSLPKLSIVNVVATSELRQFIDLEKLAEVSGFFYNKAIYHCAYLKERGTRAKISIFATGKMISIGTKSIKAATSDLTYATHRLVDLGLISPTKISVKLRNVVATADLGHSIDLENLARSLPHLLYEPEQFPAAIYHAEELEGASLLIFATGKVVLAGLRNEKSLENGKHVLAQLA